MVRSSRLLGFSHVMQNGIVHKRVPPYHPASNGQAERIVQELKKSLRCRPPSVSVPMQISRFLFLYRNTPHTLTQVTPPSLLFKFTPTTRFSLLLPNFAGAVRGKQSSQFVSSRGFSAGDEVWLLNPVQQRGSKWIQGVVQDRFGSFVVFRVVRWSRSSCSC